MEEYLRVPRRKKKKKILEIATKKKITISYGNAKKNMKKFREFQDSLRKAMPGLVEQYQGDGKK